MAPKQSLPVDFDLGFAREVGRLWRCPLRLESLDEAVALSFQRCGKPYNENFE